MNIKPDKLIALLALIVSFISLLLSLIFVGLPPITMDTMIAVLALLVGITSLALSVFFWLRSFRPIVTVMVKTYTAKCDIIAYDLEIFNSGTIPAKNIRLSANEDDINRALGNDVNDENKKIWICCFEPETRIKLLRNNEGIRCSFGTTTKNAIGTTTNITTANDNGFWKYESIIPITIEYQSWFGKKYHQSQEIQIIDSNSFTGYMWG